jgi:hypothetical protein
MKSIEKYEGKQKALVVYYQRSASFVEKKTEKMSIVSANISEKMCVPVAENSKSIEKSGNLTSHLFRCIIYTLTKQGVQNGNLSQD